MFCESPTFTHLIIHLLINQYCKQIVTLLVSSFATFTKSVSLQTMKNIMGNNKLAKTNAKWYFIRYLPSTESTSTYITTYTRMWILIYLFAVCLTSSVRTLDPFDPWDSSNNGCMPSMDECSFHLRATNAITMFYKNLYRVVATNNSVLHKYDDRSKVFDPEDILTGDGYPKLVIDFSATQNNQ